MQTCDNCCSIEKHMNKVLVKDEMVFVEEQWCDYCTEKYAKKCEDCGTLMESSYTILTNNGKRICSKCLKKYLKEKPEEIIRK